MRSAQNIDQETTQDNCQIHTNCDWGNLFCVIFGAIFCAFLTPIDGESLPELKLHYRTIGQPTRNPSSGEVKNAAS
jgi:hypothetical protein